MPSWRDAERKGPPPPPKHPSLSPPIFQNAEDQKVRKWSFDLLLSLWIKYKNLIYFILR
jgi:hypothetical protein